MITCGRGLETCLPEGVTRELSLKVDDLNSAAVCKIFYLLLPACLLAKVTQKNHTIQAMALTHTHCCRSVEWSELEHVSGSLQVKKLQETTFFELLCCVLCGFR